MSGLPGKFLKYIPRNSQILSTFSTWDKLFPVSYSVHYHRLILNRNSIELKYIKSNYVSREFGNLGEFGDSGKRIDLN